MIMHAFNDHYGTTCELSANTIRHIMKSKLCMRFKKVEKINSKTLGSTNIRLLCESMTLQSELQHLGYEMIFIDEFSWSNRRNNLYGWCRAGRKRYINFNESTFTMSFMVAFSKFRFYGLMGSNSSVDSPVFGVFLHKLIKSIVEDHNLDLSNLVFVMDNAPTHKSRYIQTMIKNKIIRILTIAPYEP